jgi:hypothetical protein
MAKTRLKRDGWEYSDHRGGYWSLKLPWVIIVVCRRPEFPPDLWLVYCHQAGICDHELGCKDIDEAKKEAVLFVRDYLKNYLLAVEQHCEKMELAAAAGEISPAGL